MREHYSYLYTYLSYVDPTDALDRLERTELENEIYRDLVRDRIALELVKNDPDEADATIETIKDGGIRSGYLLYISDRLPKSAQARKLAMIERSAVIARTLDPMSKMRYLSQAALRSTT